MGKTRYELDRQKARADTDRLSSNMMLNLSPQRINSHFARVGRVALLRITCGERLQYQVSAVIRMPTPFAAKGGDDRESICHVPDTFSYPLPARKMIFCNTDGRRVWLAKLPSRKEATAEFLDANKPTSIHPHFCWGRKSNAATQRRGTTQPRPRNT